MPGTLLPVLPDYEDDEDRPEGAMDTAEMGDIMDETGDQMEFEAGSSKDPDFCKEGLFTGRQQHNSSEESLTFKAREFIAKNKRQNLGGGGVFNPCQKNNSCADPPPLHRPRISHWTEK